MRVDTSLDRGQLTIGKPEVVIDFGDRNMGGFALHPDGRILVNRSLATDTRDEVQVIVGWDG